MKQIIKFNEKYGGRYFDASTPEALNAACVKVLRERVEAGYWYRREYAGEFEADRRLSTEEREALLLTDEQVQSLPEPLKAKFTQARSSAAHKKGAWERNKKREDAWFAEVDRILSNPDPDTILVAGEEYGTYAQGRSLAFLMLSNRSDYQYEGLKLITLEKVED